MAAVGLSAPTPTVQIPPYSRGSALYLQTLESVEQSAPHVSFEVRPFRSDLLEGGDVVIDFAKHFLEIDDVPPAESEDRWSNRGPPDRTRDGASGRVHPGCSGTRFHDNTILNRLRDIVLKSDIPESQAIAEFRCRFAIVLSPNV